MRAPGAHRFVLLITALLLSVSMEAQDNERPFHSAGYTEHEINIDGHLDEGEWANAPVLTELTMVEPDEGLPPSEVTSVRVLANARAMFIGIRCNDLSPDQIVHFSKLRDADLEEEDHVRIVLDPFLDGQSGYIIAVNANGARYDALVSNRGEGENPDWDAVWEARTSVDEQGWTVEIKLPVQSINFKKGLSVWGFNVERRIQRKQEIIRWANARRDQWFIQTSRAGLLTNLPEFSYGFGLTVRPSLVTGIEKIGRQDNDFSLEPSLDINQRLGPNILASASVNTDFAETEVDTRQTNLTRFPLFFPEKRSFFLEGSDIFEFGFGTGSSTVLPFFSRRIGLYRGNPVPVRWGTKLNGRAGQTAFGGLVTSTDDYSFSTDTLSQSTMGAFRVRQNILKESTVGLIGTFGDPLGRDGSWMSGADFTYQTTEFQGDKNFIAGVWGLYTDREDLDGDQSAFGLKLDYPNDLFDIAAIYARIGEGFDPSLGFVPRTGVHYIRTGLTYAPRPKWKLVRQMFHEAYLTYITTINGEWQTYGVFTAPVNWLLESGERFEIFIHPQGENLLEPFEIEDGVIIDAGKYPFTRAGVEIESAAKRKLRGEAAWIFGSFYDGHLHELEIEAEWSPTAVVEMQASWERNIGRLPSGDFNQTLLGFLLRFNVTSDLQFNGFVQYDTESREFGANIRAHWIFSPLGDAFLVFNHNTFDDPVDGWILQSRQVLFKVRYNFRV